MDGRLKLIEQQLIGIDSAAFQNLCDVYLALREQELASINRTGSMLGKQKTVKGTPDTFYRLADGSLRYVEYTPSEQSGSQKGFPEVKQYPMIAKSVILAQLLCNKLEAQHGHSIGGT